MSYRPPPSCVHASDFKVVWCGNIKGIQSFPWCLHGSVVINKFARGLKKKKKGPFFYRSMKSAAVPDVYKAPPLVCRAPALRLGARYRCSQNKALLIVSEVLGAEAAQAPCLFTVARQR